MIETWMDIQGYKGLYTVSSLGRIRSLGRTITRKNGSPMTFPVKILRQRPTPQGYQIVHLYKSGTRRAHSVHRLVAILFVSNWDQKEQVNHIDGDKLNNRAENLEWVTSSENQKHAFDSGLLKNPIMKGEVNPRSKLTADGIRQIRSSGARSTTLASHYGVSISTIQRVRAGGSWSHIK